MAETATNMLSDPLHPPPTESPLAAAPQIAQPNVQIQPAGQPLAIPLAPPAAQGAALAAAPPQTHRLVRPEFINGLASWLFRLGFASIFLVNSIYAAFQPADFTDLLNANLVGQLIGHAELMVKVVMVNDLLIGAFILLNRYKKVVYIWAGTWLLLVAGLKMMNLIF